jgi:uncharacterized membrane protein HdeD (DUF308 family)
MSSETVVSSFPGAEYFGDLSKRWGWLLALGILFIVLGVIGIGMAFALTVASLIVFAVLLLVGGGVQVVQAFQSKGWKSVVLHLLIAILYLFAGVAVLQDPLLASLVLTLMLAGIILAIGVVRVVIAIQMRGSKGWGFVLLGGIVSIALGVLIYMQWPVSALWVIGLFVAIDLIANGWSYVFIALAARDAGKATAGAS